MLERNATVNKELYIAQLHRVNEAIRLKKPHRQGQTILFRRPHVAQVVKAALQNLKWEVLQHPSYSPDLAPTDYYLFCSFSNHMRGVTFDNEEDLKNWLNKFFDTRPGPFRLRRAVPQGSVLEPVLFPLYINNLPTFLPASVKTSLYADDLAIWASSQSVECATSVVQAALNRLVEWSSKWRLPLNPLKCETSFFSLDPYQSRIQPSLHILNTPLKFNPHPTFLGVTFDRTLFFKHHVLYLQKKFTADSVLSAPSPLPPGVHQKNPYVPYTKPSFAPSSPMLSKAGFFSHLLLTSPPWRGCIDLPLE